MYPLISVLLILKLQYHLNSADDFTEEIIVTNLENGFIGFHFNFLIKTPETVNPKRHFDLFPKSVSDLLTKYSVEEIQLALVRGYWDNKNWGYPFISAPSGAAELAVWFKKNTRNVDQQWQHLTQSLSGHFCASINQLSKVSQFVRPVWSFRPQGVTQPHYAQSSDRYLRYGQLPHETVCTENLTPWAKLLPCKRLDGLAALLNVQRMFQAHYNALSLSARRICWDETCQQIGLELKQTLTIVLDRRFISSDLSAEWKLKDFFPYSRISSCPLASSSRILFLSGPGVKLSPPPTKQHSLDSDKLVLFEYDLKTSKSLDHISVSEDKSASQTKRSMPILFTKYATGVGNEFGGVRNIITSNSDEHRVVVFMDMIPWYMSLQYQSLEVTVNGRPRKPRKVYYKPSLTRSRMGHLELVMDLPAKSQVTVSYRFHKILQRWNEFPPDANHGFYLPAGSLSFLLNEPALDSFVTLDYHALPQSVGSFSELMELMAKNSNVSSERFVRLHSECVLVSLPSPDFSMPFNVLCIVCSLIAVGFGTIHKYTTSAMVGAHAKQKGKLMQRISALKEKYFGKSETKSD